MSKIELISKKYPFVDISKPDILLKRAENLQQNGNVTAALQIASDLKLIFPDSFDIGLLIGRCHVQLQNWHIAIKVFQELLEIQHDRCGLHNELSAIYLEIGDVKKALDQICLEIEYSPQNHEYYYNKGLILEQNGDLQNAIDSISQAIQLSEGFAWGYCERGRLYYLQNNLDAAEKDLVHATSINSRFPEALHNLSLVYLERGRFDSKIEMEQRALAIRPNYVSSKYGLSTTMLLLGDYEKGLQLYESRKDRPSNSHIKNRLKFNHWLGFENLSNKHLIVISEQGLGDIIQFSRFVLKVAKFAKRVTFEVPEALLHLLRPSFAGSNVKLTSGVTKQKNSDLICAVCSLPLAIINHTKSSFLVDGIQYLKAMPNLKQKWSKFIEADKFCIAVNWQGSKSDIDRNRSFDLAHLEALSKIPGVKLISVQKGFGIEQISNVKGSISIIDLGEELDTDAAFLDTAALIEMCDLTVTSDTSIAHLAGALGVRCFVALKHVPDWRWGHTENTTPWYNSLELFRQTEFNDWAGVFNCIVARVEELAAQKCLQAPN